MNKMKNTFLKKNLRKLAAILAMVFVVNAMPFGSVNASAADIKVLPFTSPLDYSLDANWLYDGVGDDKEVDVFMVAPTVDTKSESNAKMTEGYKKVFRYAMNQQQALYAETSKLYAPYYRQGAMNIYNLSESIREQALEIAYLDVSAAFKYYIRYKNNGRPFILAGFSQGADMCYRLLEEYFGGQSAEAVSLRENLVAVYAIGWAMTEEMVQQYPQIVPATGEDDLGVVISFDCEDGTVTDSIVVPAGQKAISINPLNWRTDSVVASKSLNIGTVTQDSKTGAVTSVTAHKCGAYIDPSRGTLIVTDLDFENYPTVLTIFPEGSLHLYDNFLFFANLKENIQLRTRLFLEQRNASSQAAG